MKTIELESSDPAEMQNLLIRKYRNQFLSFFTTSIVLVIITIHHYLSHWELIKDSENPIAFFSTLILFASIIVLIVLIFVYLESPVLFLEKRGAEDSLYGVRNRMEENQIKLATLLSQIEILKKNSVNVTNLVDQADGLKEDILLAEKQSKRLEQCLKDLDDCTINSFYKYIIYLFKGVKSLKIA